MPEMLSLPESGRARGPEGFLRRAPLARRAAVLQVLRLLQVPDRPALHGSAELPLLLGGVQKENLALDWRKGFTPSSPQPRVKPGLIELRLESEAGKTNTGAAGWRQRWTVNTNRVPGTSNIETYNNSESICLLVLFPFCQWKTILINLSQLDGKTSPFLFIVCLKISHL